MKYIVILTDGMADETYEELNGKTPLEAAHIPFLNRLAAGGEIGLVTTVPESMSPGSDVANLAIIGYDPVRYHNGRSSLEAVSMGIELKDDDITFRCNLVTLSGEADPRQRTMLDYSAGEISTQESAILMRDLGERLNSEEIRFYPGISYRNLLVWQGGCGEVSLTPPHDISGRVVDGYLPEGPCGEMFRNLMEASREILADHPVNRERIRRGLAPANSVWFWGMARKPRLDSFRDKYGLNGAVISAVDLIKGIGISAGMRSIDVEGATGTIHTNFEGKMQAAVEALDTGSDYLYLHLEAPDECGHQGDLAGKVRSIELIEQKVVEPLCRWLDSSDHPYRMLILPDHPTPVRIRTHTREPVPFVLYDSTVSRNRPEQTYSEGAAAASGTHFPGACALVEHFLGRTGC